MKTKEREKKMSEDGREDIRHLHRNQAMAK